MQVNCNNVQNKKAIRLWKFIEKWANSDVVNQNIQSPYSAAMGMFESRFHMPIEAAVLLSKEQGGFLTNGNINMFIKDLGEYTKRVASDKFSSIQAAEGFMTGSILGKKDPLLKESIDKIRGIIESDSKRSSDLSQKFDTIIELIKSAGGMDGIFSNVKLNMALRKHRKLEIEHVKALDSGDQKLIDKTRLDLENFENKGSVKTFTEFIKIIETTMPEAIKIKYNEEVELANSGDKKAQDRVKRYDNGTLLVRLTDEDYSDFLPKVGVPNDLVAAAREYNKLMSDSYDHLRNGIIKVVDSIVKRIANRPEFSGTSEKLENMKENLISEIMPKYKEDGYFPHFVRDLNATMMDGLMTNIDDLQKTNIDMSKEKKTIESIVDSMNLWIVDHAKTRSKHGDHDYSKNFIDVVSTYIQNVSKFNTTAFLNDAFMDSLFKAKNMYAEESEYSQKIVSLMDSLYGSVNGNARHSGYLHEVKKALLGYQFINKLGISPRAALKNATQFLMNLATMTTAGVRESMRYLKEQAPLGNINIEDFLKDANLYMDTSESAIESGITKESASIYKIRRMDENGKIFYGNEEDFLYKGIKIFGKGINKVAQVTSWAHRTAENANRTFTAKIAYAQMHKALHNSVPFDAFLKKQKEKGNITSVNAEKNRLAKNYAKNMVILNHFDYNSYAKARNMREGVGQFVFQFQHYGLEFMEKNYSIYKEAMGDWEQYKKKEDKFSNWFKDAAGVHRAMNMSTAYFIGPALFEYMTGYSQTLIEHVGFEMAHDLYLLLFSDWDDPEELEKINREFYGKGIIGSKLGPTVNTIMDIGVATELINADTSYINNILINTGDFANEDNMGAVARNTRLLNQFLGRTVDRWIPMATKSPYGVFSAIAQEATLYPKKASDGSFYRDHAEPAIKKAFPDYYFEKLQKKSKKKQKYSGVTLEMQHAFYALEQAGKR